MKKIGIVLGILFIVGIIYLMLDTPIPTTFVVEDSPLEINVNQEKQFVDLDQLYPDESYNSFKCVCEDENVAQVIDKINVKGISQGTTKITCSAKKQELATIEIVVK